MYRKMFLGDQKVRGASHLQVKKVQTETHILGNKCRDGEWSVNKEMMQMRSGEPCDRLGDHSTWSPFRVHMVSTLLHFRGVRPSFRQANLSTVSCRSACNRVAELEPVKDPHCQFIILGCPQTHDRRQQVMYKTTAAEVDRVS